MKSKYYSWRYIWYKNSLESNSSWPLHDENKLVESSIEMVVSINGKVRDRVKLSLDTPKEEVINLAMAAEKIKDLVAGKEIKKVIVVPNKLVNIVI